MVAELEIDWCFVEMVRCLSHHIGPRTVLITGIDAIETRGNTFKTWVSVVHENPPLQTDSLSLRKVMRQRKKREA